MNVPQPIPYQGSKRNIAGFILSFFPHQIDTLVEPFAGSAAVSLAAACHGKASRFHLNDVNQALMDLWYEIVHNPKKISDGYEKLWNEQYGNERGFYDLVRDEFNRTRRPDYFLYLLARCVKASVRYNPKGEFNQSPDNRRRGRHPQRMRNDIFAASNLLYGRTKITSEDYRDVLKSVSKMDLVYMDPPYQGVSNGRDPRYYTGIDPKEFLHQLEELVRHRISFILSYDGRKGQKIYGEELPAEMGVYRIEVRAGRSTQSTLLGRNDITYESIYLSNELVNRLGVSLDEIINKLSSRRAAQLVLIAEEK